MRSMDERKPALRVVVPRNRQMADDTPIAVFSRDTPVSVKESRTYIMKGSEDPYIDKRRQAAARKAAAAASG